MSSWSMASPLVMGHIPVGSGLIVAARFFWRSGFHRVPMVSHGRNGRNVGGLSVGGKNSGNVGFIWKFGGVAKVGSVSPTYGGEIFGKIGGNRRVVGKAPAVVSGRKFTNPTKNRKLGNNVLGGYMFTVLSDIVDEDSATKNVSSKSIDKGKGASNSVLSKISNRALPRKKFISPSHPNKYLSISGANKGRGINPFKENLCGDGVNVCKEGSSGLVEDLEDSDVLRSLHVSVMDFVMVSLVNLLFLLLVAIFVILVGIRMVSVGQVYRRAQHAGTRASPRPWHVSLAGQAGPARRAPI
ncbi:hypothetical protein LWI28_000908 [Acer negundo]|uniref:Uncharacterized protein n=1 Tax=Acer negundo TaxID=4023 RepID=A0AAD5NEZ3_ACENE|nr:hypothetical protein LWI28_000908 [Acer negundo]